MTASSLTLTTLRDRVELGLMDVSNRSWDTGTLDEAIKLALEDLGRVAGAALTVSGLNAAVATTVDVLDEGTLITGALAYAGGARAVNRTEKVNLGQEGAPALYTWSRQKMAEFEKRLERVSTRIQRASSSSPNSALLWDEDDPDW